MGDADILKNLREQVLDDLQPLGGLLRKCLALGAVTGSDELRAWASNELRGYPEDAVVPPYRLIHAPLFVDSVGGRSWVKAQQINRAQIPKDLRQYVPEALDFRQPVEELAQMAAGKDSVQVGRANFSLVASRWSRQLPMFQDIMSLYYSIMPSTFAGMVDMARTTLVEIVIDLAKGIPLHTLPSSAKIDSVVQVHVGSSDKYEVNVSGSNTGIIGQGSDFSQTQKNTLPTGLVEIIEKMRASFDSIDDPSDRADVEQAVDDFDEAVSEDDPNPEKIKRRSRALERVVTALGKAGVTEVVHDGIQLAADQFHLVT